MAKHQLNVKFREQSSNDLSLGFIHLQYKDSKWRLEAKSYKSLLNHFLPFTFQSRFITTYYLLGAVSCEAIYIRG